MGIREDHHIGLNTWARKLLDSENVTCKETITRTFEDGHLETLPARTIVISKVKREESEDSYTGMFEDKFPLLKYTFPDGRVYTEFVQTAPWSSGPCFFLALNDTEGKTVKESLWTDEEKYL